MYEKKQMLESLAALAKKLGRAPSLLEFVAKARVTKHSVMRHFGKWNDAVRAAEPGRVRISGRPKASPDYRLSLNQAREFARVIVEAGIAPSTAQNFARNPLGAFHRRDLAGAQDRGCERDRARL